LDVVMTVLEFVIVIRKDFVQSTTLEILCIIRRVSKVKYEIPLDPRILTRGASWVGSNSVDNAEA
jgi:hypothetical protein